MRIAFVSTQAQFTAGDQFASGPANYLLRVSKALADMGHESLLFSIGSQREQMKFGDLTVISTGGRAPGRASRIMRGSLHPHTYYSRVLNDALLEYHTEETIDVVQYTNYRAPALFRPKEIPAVIRASSYRPLWDAHHETGGRTRSRRKATDLEVKAYRRVDAVYAPSKLLAEAIHADLGIPVEVVEPPFFLEVDERDESIRRELLGSAPYILFVGSFTERKGAHLIGAIAEDILRSDPELLIALAGRDKPYGESTMLDFIRSSAGQQQDRIVHLGELPHSQLYALIPESRAMVLPSLMDNLPNSCLEAMALGSVVIGTRGASFDQLIRDGENGYLIERGSAPALAEAVQRALSLDSQDRNWMASAAQSRIKELSPERVVPKLVNLFERVARSV